MIKIYLQLFGGGKKSKTTYQAASVPDASADEQQLQANQMNYANNTYNNAGLLTNAEMDAANNSVYADWQNIYDNTQAQMAANQAQANTLASGVLPAEYSANRQAALNADLQGTMGNAISSLGNRGILNSTTTNNALNGISQNAANTLAANYGTDMNTASGLLSNSQNLSNQAITNAANASTGSMILPTAYSDLATAADAPTSTLLTNMSNNRYTMASPAQTIVQQGNGGLLGGLANAAAAYYGACFKAGTKIETIEGELPIENIMLHDQVVTPDGLEKVTAIYKANKPIVVVETHYGKVNTTETQRLMTPNGLVRVINLKVGDEVETDRGTEEIKAIINTGYKEKVYELDVTGKNLFYADGFLVDGMTEVAK